MKVTIGIYRSQNLAVAAIMKLKEFGYQTSDLTILGIMKTEQRANDLQVPQLKSSGLENAANLGAISGILSGIGILDIPGIGFLFGAGALAGVIAGFDPELISGGIITVLDAIGIKNGIAKKYHDALVAGKFLIIIQGSEEDIRKSGVILKLLDRHAEIATY